MRKPGLRIPTNVKADGYVIVSEQSDLRMNFSANIRAILGCEAPSKSGTLSAGEWRRAPERLPFIQLQGNLLLVRRTIDAGHSIVATSLKGVGVTQLPCSASQNHTQKIKNRSAGGSAHQLRKY
jgi:hypothetical protein